MTLVVWAQHRRTLWSVIRAWWAVIWVDSWSSRIRMTSWGTSLLMSLVAKV